MATKFKRKSISIEEKISLIERLENGERNRKLGQEFGISSSTISAIWKNRHKTKLAFGNNNFKSKRLRKSIHDDLDQCLIKWYKEQESSNGFINGPILREKANEFAEMLGKEDFQCSEGWIYRFRLRHDIGFKKSHEEPAHISNSSQSWLMTVFEEIRKDYNDDDIFNAHEIGLFYKMTYDKTIQSKVDGKTSNEMITILIAANITGNQKRKLFIVGKIKNPGSFNYLMNLPVIYNHNETGKMSTELFTKYILDWDEELKRSSRKILLLVDNCLKHPNIDNLRAIKLCFPPKNHTSILQPLNRGVISSLKTHYRKMQILENIKNIELKRESNITLLDAMLMLHSAWEKVTSETIVNCFKQSGYAKATAKEIIKVEENALLDPLISDAQVTEFINMDNDLETWDDYNEHNIMKFEETYENQLEEKVLFQIPSCAEALQAVDTIKKFAIHEGLTDKDLLEGIFMLDNKFQEIFCNRYGKQDVPF